MPKVTTTNQRVITPPTQRVTLNGRVWREVEALQITDVYGLRASTAVLSLPAAYAEKDMSSFDSAEVVIWAHDSREPTSRDPVFRGWIDADSAREDASTSSVFVTAQDVRSRLDRVMVGQRDLEASHYYPHRDRTTGDETGYTLTSILRSLFSTDFLPNDWSAVLGLGYVRGLTNAEADVEMPDILFHATNYREALRKLLGLVPDVMIRARYTESKTLLDFNLWGAGTAGRKRIKATDTSTGPEEGAYLQAYVRQSESRRTYSRVIGFGRPFETMITLSTGHADSPLVPAWDSGVDIYGETPSYTTDEQTVLADASYATPGSTRFDPQYENIFRRFQLPASIPWWSVKDKNTLRIPIRGDITPPAVQGAILDYQQLSVQVFKPKRPKLGTDSGDASGTLLFNVVANEFEMIEGAKLEDGFLVLPEPAVALTKQNPDQTGVYVPAPVYVTLTVGDPYGRRLFYDTGARDEKHEAFSNEGLTFSFINETVGYSRLGTDTDEFGSSAGFGCTYYDPEDQTWNTVAAGSPSVVEDDTQWLVNMCERELSERNRRRTSVDVTLPLFWSGFAVTQELRITGRNIDNKTFTVLTITRNLKNPETSIFATDSRPLLVRADQRGINEFSEPATSPASPFNNENRPMEAMEGPILPGVNPFTNGTDLTAFGMGGSTGGGGNIPMEGPR